jgi:O-acetylhomoserine (thiol)-lyase
MEGCRIIAPRTAEELRRQSVMAVEEGIPLVVDNTVGIGLVRPFDYGADIIASSATKYIGGHGNVSSITGADSGCG